MILTEYDEEKVMNMFREEGREEGRLEERRRTARELRDNNVAMDVITKCTGLTEDEVREL